MNECPTRVRTGTPPSSVTSSGTARLVIRLWMIVEPGDLSSSRAAISAVSVEGETARPRSSTRKHRSASPSKARPRSACSATTRCCRSTRLASSIGLASWFGKVPSSSKYIGTSSTRSSPRRPNTAGAVWPAMPLPASTTTLSRRPSTGASDTRCAAYASRTSWASSAPSRVPRRTSPPATRSRISARPVSSPTGRASLRQSFIPLYCAGLWLAVNIAPARPRCPEAK